MSGETVDQILQEARDKISARESRLRPFVDELGHATAAVKVLDKALGAGKTSSSSTGGNQTPGSSPRQRFTERVQDMLRKDGPLTSTQIAQGLGRGVDSYLTSILTNGVLQGTLTEDDGEYGMRP